MNAVAATLASIPSPSFNSIDIGPLSLNLYGLSIAIGVVAAVWLMGRRFVERGVGTTDDASSIAIWAVIAGVIGARLYHVATDWDRFDDDYAAIPKIWEGGLGIPGGLLLGIPVGLYLARSKGVGVAAAATCAAPAIPLAQAIGRWGNYFNQELYGRPTELPWALEIDADHLVTNPDTGQLFELGTTFHPTFLYESLWSLALVALLLFIDRNRRPATGALMGLYLAGYGLGRFWVEGLRVDPADELGPFRWNQWVALAGIVGGLALWAALRNRVVDAPAGPESDPEGDPEIDGSADQASDDGLEPGDIDTDSSLLDSTPSESSASESTDRESKANESN
ncbi:MAG: prolipoprotein diacylglyceryl transferase [Ilumatobacter sp.]|uniref:prolipoprotein diacylglyceryl transferase n=1 Tax=Ilumatobacter sp. TaxID=1967498 RepID=UPI00391D447C